MKKLLWLAALLPFLAQAQTVTLTQSELDTKPDVYRGTAIIIRDVASHQACLDAITADALVRKSPSTNYTCRTSTAVTAKYSTVVTPPPDPEPPADPVTVLKPASEVAIPTASPAPASNPTPTLTSISATEWLVTIPTATARINVFTQPSADAELDSAAQTYVGSAPVGTTMFKMPKAANTWLRLGAQNSSGYATGKSTPLALGPVTVTPPPVVEPPPITGGIDLTGSRVITKLDADVANASTDSRIVTQLADNVQYNNAELQDVPSPGVKHSDGSDWLTRVTGLDGKPAWKFRLRQGQPVFQSNTLRAEVFAGYQSTTVGMLTGGDYWMAIDWMFDADMFASGTSDGISLFDLHGQPGFSGTPASGYHGMAFRLNSNRQFTFHTFAEQGSEPGKTYNVTNGPSTTVIGTVNSQPGGPHGTPNTYILDTATQPNVWYRFVVRMKLSTGSDGRTEVWRKKGTGAMVKVLDVTGPNTGPANGSYRYQKTGIYKFDATFGASPSRTFHRRSWVILKNEGTVDAPSLMAWMER